MSSRILMMVVASLLAATIVIGAGLSFQANNAFAQMTQPGMMAGNMTSGTMMGPGMMQPGMMGPEQGRGMMGPMNQGMMGPGMMQPGMMAGNQSIMTQMIGADRNITGSIKLPPATINALPTIINAITSQVNVTLSQAVTTAEQAAGNNSHALSAHVGESNGYLTYLVSVIRPDMRVNTVIVDPGNGQVLSNKGIPLQAMMMGPGMMQPGMMGPGMMQPGMMGPGMAR